MSEKRKTQHMQDEFKSDLFQLEQFFSNQVREHGDTPQGNQHKDMELQERRMEVLADVGDLRCSKVLDFGCGTGHLLAFLRTRLAFQGEYVGYDLSAEMIAIASNKFPGIRFERRNILTQGVPEDFDHILINGTFFNRVTDNWGLMTELLGRLFPRTRKALAFNALSTYVDFFNPGNFYVSPENIFRFCKERLSPCVTLRHDYLSKPGVVPFEFTVYVSKTDVEPRKQLSV